MGLIVFCLAVVGVGFLFNALFASRFLANLGRPIPPALRLTERQRALNVKADALEGLLLLTLAMIVGLASAI